MRGMGRLWQAAGTVKSVLAPGLLEKAAACGLRSLFVGFETLNQANLRAQHKYQNLDRDYGAAIRRLHDLGVMVNGSFVFGMDDDDATVFARTVDWAVGQGIETATFHILTPYPGTGLYQRMRSKAGSSTATGTSTTRGTWSFARAADARRRWRPATGAPTATSLRLGQHPARRRHQADLARAAAPRRLCRRLEEVRAAVGLGDPRPERHVDVESERAFRGQGGHGTASVSAGRGMSAILLALR